MKTCKTCGFPLVVRQTKRTAAQLAKPYYYTAYYYCPHCQKMYHDDAFKVVNTVHVDTLFTNPASSEETLNIWTDGACSFNGTQRAKAAWAFVSGEHEESGLVEGKQTNNTAEAYAIYYALVWAAKQKNYTHIRIHSDSQISLYNMAKRVDMIKENRAIFQKIFDVIEEKHLSVSFEKVMGHSDDVNNNRADNLANGLVGIK